MHIIETNTQRSIWHTPLMTLTKTLGRAPYVSNASETLIIISFTCGFSLFAFNENIPLSLWIIVGFFPALMFISFLLDTLRDTLPLTDQESLKELISPLEKHPHLPGVDVRVDALRIKLQKSTYLYILNLGLYTLSVEYLSENEWHSFHLTPSQERHHKRVMKKLLWRMEHITLEQDQETILKCQLDRLSAHERIMAQHQMKTGHWPNLPASCLSLNS